MGLETLHYQLWIVVLVLLYSKIATSKDLAIYNTNYACDGKIMKIECKENEVIDLIRANYGRNSITVCNDNGNTDWSENCMSTKSFTILHGHCSQKQNCSVLASPSLFDDQCPGTVKYLEAHYTCAAARGLSLSTKSKSTERFSGNQSWTIVNTPSLTSAESSIFVISPTSSGGEKAETSSGNLNRTKTMAGLQNHNDDQVPMCRPINMRNLAWNWTSGGDMSTQPCPGGATGFAHWHCQTISKNLAIWYPDTPDLSECQSMWLSSLESRINKQDSLIKIATDLCQMTESKTLFGRDMLITVKIIRDLAHKIANNMQMFPNLRQHEALVSDFLQNSVQLSSNLLDVSQSTSWKDLSFSEQMRVVSSLLIGLKEDSFLLADMMRGEKEVMYCMKNILLKVQVLQVSNIDDKQIPSYTSKENCQLRNNNWLHLHKSSLKENSDGGFVRLVYIAFDTLEHILRINPDANQTVSGGGGGGIGAKNNFKEKKINSKVLSASLGKGHIQLAEPVILCLQHLQTENFSNPTCVIWDYMQNQWSEKGCMLLITNQTHTICQCSHLTNFAIMVDVSPPTQNH